MNVDGVVILEIGSTAECTFLSKTKRNHKSQRQMDNGTDADVESEFRDFFFVFIASNKNVRLAEH